MRSRHLAPTLLLAGLTLLPLRAVRAQQAVTDGRIESGTLSFDGHATMGDFTGVTSTLSGELTGAPELPGVRGWVEAPVATLKTGKGKRDTDLNKSMESEKYPTIRYELDGVTQNGWRADTADVTLHGRFLIHGVTREADLQGRVVIQDTRIRVLAQTPLNLKDYRIGGLSKMLGMLKMHEDILVHVDLTFATDQAIGVSEAAVTAGGGGSQ